MSLRNKSIAWFNNEFQRDPLFLAMENCVEASPWHRENSVATHTRMVVSEYISWVDKEWTIQTLIGFMAAVFHDTGKPVARVEKFKPERGIYNSFGGHEIISARLWENYAMENLERFKELFGGHNFNIIHNIIHKVSFVIEHHMPYQVSPDKIQDIAITAAQYFTEPVFQNHLTADTHGRIADDHEEKIAAVDTWIVEFEKQMKTQIDINPSILGGKTLYLAIGPSGCGKSTHFLKLKHKDPTIVHYSWDALRLEWYNPDYEIAYKMSVDDTQFNNKATKTFCKLVSTGKNIYVDNTNLSRKRRRPFITEARKHGYTVIGLVFPITINTLLNRQFTRPDKCVPSEAVNQHYMSLQVPLYGEFDHIEVVNTISQ